MISYKDCSSWQPVSTAKVPHDPVGVPKLANVMLVTTEPDAQDTMREKGGVSEMHSCACSVVTLGELEVISCNAYLCSSNLPTRCTPLSSGPMKKFLLGNLCKQTGRDHSLD